MSNQLIPANLDKFVKAGIQTGTSDQRMAELSNLQRQLYQSTDFHFASGGLYARVDETVIPKEGRNKLERDWDALLDVAEQIIQQLHASGFFYQPVENNMVKAEGVTCEFLKEIPEISNERVAERYAIDLIKSEANAIFKETNKAERERLLTESRVGSTLCKAAITSNLDIRDREIAHDLYGLIQDILSQELHKLYLEDPIIDVYEDASGIHIITGSKLHITLNNVDLNSQFGGDGYTPSKDSYRRRAVLKYDDQTEVSKAKLEREWACVRLINDIRRIDNHEELVQHRTEVVNELYAPDKLWRAKWSQEAEDQAVQKEAEELLSESTIQHVTITTKTYTIVLNGSTYSARSTHNSPITSDSWYDDVTNIKLPSAVAQKVHLKFLESEVIPTEHNENLTIIPITHNPPLDEAHLSEVISRLRWIWNQNKLRATTDLNFTYEQWNKIFTAYENQKTIIAKTQQVREALDRYTPQESMRILTHIIDKTSVSGVKDLWDTMITPLMQRKEILHDGKLLQLNISQFNEVRKLVQNKFNSKNQ